MKNGTDVTIRPIRPEDEPMLVRFHATLSAETVYLRYFHMEKLDTRVAHERLLRKCFIDYDREMALVAEMKAAAGAESEILGVARLTRDRDTRDAEIAVLITDAMQHQGLGTEFVRRLVEIGRAEKLSSISAHILAENRGMQGLARHFGFEVVAGDDPSELAATLKLES